MINSIKYDIDIDVTIDEGLGGINAIGTHLSKDGIISMMNRVSVDYWDSLTEDVDMVLTHHILYMDYYMSPTGTILEDGTAISYGRRVHQYCLRYIMTVQADMVCDNTKLNFMKLKCPGSLDILDSPGLMADELLWIVEKAFDSFKHVDWVDTVDGVLNYEVIENNE